MPNCWVRAWRATCYSWTLWPNWLMALVSSWMAAASPGSGWQLIGLSDCRMSWAMVRQLFRTLTRPTSTRGQFLPELACRPWAGPQSATDDTSGWVRAACPASGALAILSFLDPSPGRGAESSLPVAHPGYQVLSDILFRLCLIANALTQCSS